MESRSCCSHACKGVVGSVAGQWLIAAINWRNQCDRSRTHRNQQIVQIVVQQHTRMTVSVTMRCGIALSTDR